MSQEIKSLKEERGEKFAKLEEIRSAVGKGRMTDEQRTAFDALTRDLDALDADIAREERAAKIIARSTNAPANRTDNPAAGGDSADQDPTAQERSAFLQHLKTGEERAGTPTLQSGQYLIPQTIASTIEIALKSHGAVLAVADVFTTETGAEINFPTCNDTTSEATVMEDGEEVSTDDFKMGNAKIGAHTFRTPLVPISRTLLQDAAFNMEQFITDMLTERFARGFNKAITIGTGVKEPNGVVTQAHPSSIVAADDAITYDNLVDFMAELDAAYLPSAKWMLNSQTLAALKKIKDGAGQYIFQSSVASDVPPTILGKPYVLNDQMQGIGAGKTSLLFGDFKKFKVRIVQSFQYMRLNEVFATRNAVGFLGFGRMDSNLIDAGTHPILKLTHAGEIVQTKTAAAKTPAA